MLQFSLGRELIRPLTSSISSRRRRRRLMETRTARRRLSLSATPLTLPTTQKGGGVGVSAAAAATLDRPPREASLEQTCTHHWDTFPEMEKGETREGRREKKKEKTISLSISTYLPLQMCVNCRSGKKATDIPIHFSSLPVESIHLCQTLVLNAALL